MANEPHESTSNDKKPPEGSPLFGTGFGAFVLVALLIILFMSGFGGLFQGSVEELSYSTFKAQISLGNVQSVTVQGDKIAGTLKSRSRGAKAWEARSPSGPIYPPSGTPPFFRTSSRTE